MAYRMTARPPVANTCCVDRAYHIRLIRSNRLCYYRSSHTFLITDIFAVYHTHLVILNHFCSLVSTQTVHPSEPHAVYRTHLDLADHFFVLPNHKQFIRVNRMLYIAHTFIWLPISFCCLITNSSSEWTLCYVFHTPSSGCPFLLFLLIANSSLNWIVCPASHTQLKSELCLMHPSSQMFCTFFDGFLWENFVFATLVFAHFAYATLEFDISLLPLLVLTIYHFCHSVAKATFSEWQLWYIVES